MIFMEEEKSKSYKLKKEYKKSENFKSYYITGAVGGFKNNYDFRLTFFRDDINGVVLKREEIRDNETLNQNEKEEIFSKVRVPCTLECEVIMTERALIELYNFIKKELNFLKETHQRIDNKLMSTSEY